MKILFLVLSAVFLPFLSCTKLGSNGEKAAVVSKTPEEVVREFISISAGAQSVEDRRKLQDICVGELKRTFERMSNEEFRLAYLDMRLNIKDLKILDSTTTGDSAQIRYQITVENPTGTDQTKETNSREVDLRLSQGAWYIEFIRMHGSDKLAFTRGMIF